MSKWDLIRQIWSLLTQLVIMVAGLVAFCKGKFELGILCFVWVEVAQINEKLGSSTE